MSKRCFLDYLGKAVSKDRVRKICGLMEMEPGGQEERLILERFCGKNKKGMEQCSDFYPVDQQKEDLPGLNIRVRGWCESNAGFFRLIELHGLTKFFGNQGVD